MVCLRRLTEGSVTPVMANPAQHDYHYREGDQTFVASGLCLSPVCR